MPSFEDGRSGGRRREDGGKEGRGRGKKGEGKKGGRCKRERQDRNIPILYRQNRSQGCFVKRKKVERERWIQREDAGEERDRNGGGAGCGGEKS